MADPGFANGGAKVERRRREDRGAEGIPLPNGGGVWKGGMGHGPLPRKFFDVESENGDF